MRQKINEDSLRLAGITCCSAPVTPSPKSRRLPGTITGKPGVRHLAGTVLADAIPALKF